MNEIKKCSISGIAFTFETNAYTKLGEYLDSLNRIYKNNPDGKEIISDIEARIAELILSAQSDAGKTVCMPLVENIINQLGDAEDISGEDNDDVQPVTSEPSIPKRLYRDKDNAKIGGVCAGLGKFFGVDSTFIRLSIFLPLFLSIMFGMIDWNVLAHACVNIFGLLIVAYVIMWFVVPSAKNARQKLEMNGEPITVKSISDNINTTTEEKARSVVAEAFVVLGRIFVILLKLFAALLLLPLLIVCVVLFLLPFGVMFGLMGKLFVFGNSGAIYNLLTLSSSLVITLVVACLIVFVIFIIYTLVTLLVNKTPKMKVLVTMFVVWILLIIGTVFASVRMFDSGKFCRDEVERIMKKDAIALEDAELPDERNDSEYEALVYDENAPSVDK